MELPIKEKQKILKYGRQDKQEEVQADPNIPRKGYLGHNEKKNEMRPKSTQGTEKVDSSLQHSHMIT